jgi:HK97 gp10 family phage protein
MDNGVTIEIDGLQEFIGNVRDAERTFQAEITTAMSQSVNQIKNTAQNLAPYQTGTLRRSIYTDIQDNGLTGFVGVDPDIAPYGIYIEQGTGIFVGHARWKGNIPGIGWRWINGMRAQPFFLPAWQQNMDNVKLYFQQAVNRILARAGGKT